MRSPLWPGALFLVSALSVTAQTPAPEPGHDISKVDPAPLGGSLAVPLPEAQRKLLEKYEIPEMAGSRQALGSQLIDGRLPRPLLDYRIEDGGATQRISLFEGGLVVINVNAAGGTIRKKVIIPPDAMQAYLKGATPAAIAAISPAELPAPSPSRRAMLRVYADEGFTERVFDPMAVPPKALHDATLPLGDLLRAMTEDRGVTGTLAGYEPKVGDELVGEDSRTYRVANIYSEQDVVELRCTSTPTTVYMAKKDLFQYFVGSRSSTNP
jgi:hypothetical protein